MKLVEIIMKRISLLRATSGVSVGQESFKNDAHPTYFNEKLSSNELKNGIKFHFSNVCWCMICCISRAKNNTYSLVRPCRQFTMKN